MDREKVKKELLELNAKAYGLWVHDQKNEFLAQIGNVTDDALALLKEQEPVKPKQHLVYTTKGWFCGVCDGRINRAGRYCAFCGRAVKWE